VITTALRVVGTVCGQAAAPSAAGASRSALGTAGGSAGGGMLSVLSASFVSPSAGWLLATPCPDQTCRTLVMRETADGGRA
jgi:hypothetical protein